MRIVVRSLVYLVTLALLVAPLWSTMSSYELHLDFEHYTLASYTLVALHAAVTVAFTVVGVRWVLHGAKGDKVVWGILIAGWLDCLVLYVGSFLLFLHFLGGGLGPG